RHALRRRPAQARPEPGVMPKKWPRKTRKGTKRREKESERHKAGRRGLYPPPRLIFFHFFFVFLCFSWPFLRPDPPAAGVLHGGQERVAEPLAADRVQLLPAGHEVLHDLRVPLRAGALAHDRVDPLGRQGGTVRPG